jgi:hypothetical protein
MTTLRAEDYIQCQMTLFNVARGLDTHDPSLAATQFSEHGTWTWKGRDLHGRKSIAAALASRDPLVVTRHITSNLVCEMSGPDTINATCTVVTYKSRASDTDEPAALEQPVSILDYNDTLVREASRWLIIQRSSMRILAI